jgi:hypothetical protein
MHCGFVIFFILFSIFWIFLQQCAYLDVISNFLKYTTLFKYLHPPLDLFSAYFVYTLFVIERRERLYELTTHRHSQNGTGGEGVRMQMQAGNWTEETTVHIQVMDEPWHGSPHRRQSANASLVSWITSWPAWQWQSPSPC